MEVTIELSCTKWPSVTQWESFWDDNLPSLLAYMKLTTMGVSGFIFFFCFSRKKSKIGIK